MKMPSLLTNNRRTSTGFTLIEMLVVITIIGILAGLITAAAIRARIYAKNAAITIDIKELGMACQAYKQKFGEYPPDGLDSNAFARHLRKAFPRYTGDGSGLPVTLTPQTALAFWLGGVQDANGKPTGFAADPTNPFLPATACPSRIGPFFEFDRNRLDGYRYWPQGVLSDQPGSGTTGAITYFRADNGLYDGKYQDDSSGRVYPAQDRRVNGYPWINPKSFQIFSAGLDMQYGTADPNGTLQFPTGGNYTEEVFDNITNFSGGTLEDAMP